MEAAGAAREAEWNERFAAYAAAYPELAAEFQRRIKGQLPVAFVVATAGESITADEVRSFALAHGPAYAHPRHVVLVDELPLAGTAKIDRRRLVDEAEARFGDGG